MINRVINKFNNIFFKFDPSPKGSDLIIQHIGTNMVDMIYVLTI